MSRNWLSVREESDLLDEVASRRVRLSATARSMSPQQGQLMSQYADAYPWMEPGVIQSFGQAGIPVDAPAARSVADIAAQQAAEDGKFDTPAEEVPDAWYETLLNSAGKVFKPIVRGGLAALSVPMEELQALLSAAGTALFDETETGEAGLLSDPLGNIGAVLGELARPDELLGDFWHNYTAKAARAGGIIALSDMKDLGEGWMPSGSAYQQREEDKYRLSLDGQFVTPGRLIARQFTEPGSTQYQMLSGANDFAQNLFVDPSIAVTGGLSKAQKANRLFQTTGAIPGIRKTVDTATGVNYFLTHNQGKRLVSWFTQNADVEDAWRAIGKSDLGLARRLADSTDEATTFSLLEESLGSVIREKPTAGFVSRGIGGLVPGSRAGMEYGRLFGGGSRVRRSLANVRMGLEMPGQILNVDDMNQAAHQLDSWMRNAKFSDAERKALMNDLSRLEDGDGIGLFEVARRVMDGTEGVLVQAGIKQSRAQKLTQMYPALADDLHTFGVDDLGRHQDVMAPFRVNMGGTIVDAPKGMPLLASEMANSMIPLPPSARDIRRATSSISKLVDSPLWKSSIDAVDSAMSTVWKPLQLLRGAYTFRVIAEEQMRMAGAGYDSLVNHPLKAIAWSLSVDPKSRLGKSMAKLVDQQGTMSVTGELWDDIAEHASAMSRGSAGWRGLPGEVATGRFVKARHGEDPDFYRGWTVELSHMANDPVMRRLSGGLSKGDLRSIGKSTGNTVDDVKEWFWSGTGQKFRKDWARIEGREALASNRSVADEYVDLFVERLNHSTGGNTDLLSAVANGDLGGNTLRGFGGEGKIAKLLEDAYDGAAPAFVKKPEVLRARGQNSQWNRVVEWGFNGLMSKPTNYLSRSPVFKQKYWQRVEELIDQADEATQHAIIRAAKDANVPIEGMVARAARGPGTQITDGRLTVDRLRDSDEFFFHKTTSDRVQAIEQGGLREGGFWRTLDDAQRYRDPDSPVFVFRRGEFPASARDRDVIGRVTDESQLDELLHPDSDPGDIIQAGDIIRIPRPVAVIEGGEVRMLGSVSSGLDDIDGLAKGFALDQTKKLLYDMNKRGQFFDMTRIIFPFGEAWKEIITAWTDILRKNPQTIRRFQQGLEGARQPSLLGEPETTPGSGEGFFHTDPTSGEEVFTYPLIGKIANTVLGLGSEGAGVEFVGQSSGLNIVSATVLPGFGPAIQIPASHIIPNTPSWDFVRDTLLPFGEQESILGAVTPAWMDRMREVFAEPDPEKSRLFANTVTDVMRSLAATGKHDLHSQEGQQRLLDEATAKARGVYVFRAMAQFVVPTGPQTQWWTKDTSGELFATVALAEEMRKLTEEYGGDRTAAFGEWVKRFGIDNVLAIQGKTQGLVERPVTEKGDAFLRANPELERDFALTVGLFAPEPAEGEFDYTAYIRSLETGAREGVSPENQLALVNDMLGRMQFEQAKKIAALHPGPQSSVFLAQMRQQIAEQYPGFDGWVSRAQWEKKPKPDEMITELRSAIQNPTLANTDAGRGIAKYLSALDAASQMVLALPGNTRHYQSAKSAAPIRMWLRMVARQIIEENPDFARSWELVFERELADDELALPAAA